MLLPQITETVRGEREREREMQPKIQRPKLNAKLDTDTDVKKTCNRFVL